MVLTPSNMLPLGTVAPDFSLPDTISKKDYTLSNLQSPKGTVIMFISNHCPYVKHIREKLVDLAKNYQIKGISFIAINANDAIAYPDDSPEKMETTAKTFGFTFPYLYDESQEVAKAYQAACTPDFFIFDNKNKCVYRGQFDDSRPGNNIPVTGEALQSALDHLLEGKSIPPHQKPSVGCNIKWRN